ncbi:MAG: hypothetical protein ACK4YM_10805 [Novosphingobium sp.]
MIQRQDVLASPGIAGSSSSMARDDIETGGRAKAQDRALRYSSS